MPQLSCLRCSRVLDYSGDRPSFCAYCGQSVADPASIETVAPTPDPSVIRSVRGAETVDFVEGQGTTARPVATIPDRVGGYRLIRQIGRGGMGTVFEAEDSRHGRRVALKVIAPGYVASSAAIERFRREGRLASTLAHPRCVFVLEADEDADGRPFIAMELMTGDTLQDLVEKDGPLAVGDAVAHILDVVEGLREAHRLGLIHRDVKPSNCFLDGDGRVKVGDFGLSKAQAGATSLTRTGSFLGTPLYASPEQIKVEDLDGRTDVYSTAASLFFLLIGRAPFDRGDASATMARIVTDPAPSAREKRPEVPTGLDRAIRKGLERDRDRRFRDLDEFRAALLPYLPGRVPAANVGLRVGAYLFDYALLMTLLLAILWEVDSTTARLVVVFLVMLAYFAVGDGIWGGSLGKRLLRMRVVAVGRRELAGVRRATLRALVFLPLAEIPLDILFVYQMPRGWPWRGWAVAFGLALALAAGLVALAAPMRGRADSRALHDLVGGTCVIALPRDDRRRAAGARRPIGRDRGSVTRPVGVMQAVGPYKVRGAVRWEAGRRVVSGEDSTLGREAWIVIRPKGSPPPGPARRDVVRATRPRWLAGGEQAEGRWDAYIAPAGCPLADLAGADGLSWRDARPILEDLADELAAACSDGTLTPGLTVDQVWVQPDGRAILVDPLAFAAPPAGAGQPPSDEDQALSLLRRVAALALEGGRRHVDEAPTAIRRPVPIHASTLLGRLLGGHDPCRTVAAFRDGLEATRNLPTEVTREQRATQVGILALFLAVGLAVGFGGTYVLLDPSTRDPLSAGGGRIWRFMATSRVASVVGFGSVFPALWACWDGLTLGGFSLKLTGLGLIRADGRRAPRWRCAWRSALVWSPVAALLIGSVWVQDHASRPVWAAWALFGVAAALPPIYAALALLFPSRGPHDVLSGLRVVPR